MPKKQRTILDLFSLNELKVSKLYELYSKITPTHQAFWLKLSQEEIKHGEMLKDIQNKLSRHRKLFDENKFSRQVMNYVGHFIDKEIKKAQIKKTDLRSAIDIGLRLEQSMVEKKYFEMFNPKVKELGKIMRKINRETERHAEILLKEAERITSG